MGRCLINGAEVPRKILKNHWDELVDRRVIVNGIKSGRLLGFKADGRAMFADINNNRFIIDVNDISELTL